jgi:hypothetical protein
MPAKSAVPAYLSRLARGAPASAPRLRPTRPLFPPGAVIGDESAAPTAGFASHDQPVQPFVGRPDRVATSAAPDGPPRPISDGSRRDRSGGQTPGGTTPDPLGTAPAAAQPVPRVIEAPALISARNPQHAATPESASSPQLAAPAPTPVLLPAKSARSAPEMRDYPPVVQPGPLKSPAPAAQVSIGTIEVTITPPPPPSMPAPPLQAQAAFAGAPGRAGADTARQAARGASRRWFGAGQS